MALTIEQEAALKAFASKNGRNWKSKLSHVWATGDWQYEQNAAELQRVRNTLGSAWLRTYKLER